LGLKLLDHAIVQLENAIRYAQERRAMGDGQDRHVLLEREKTAADVGFRFRI
jgi:hypothetical protein